MKLTFVTDERGEWQALYVDGDKFEEGHQITVKDMVDLLVKSGLCESVEHRIINDNKYDGEESYTQFYSSLSDFDPDDFK